MRVLLNLSDNACNAAGDTGQVALSLALASEKSGEVTLAIGHQPYPPFAILTVTDTGPGIPEALLGQIWERGFSTKGQPGSGQGLALVQNRIERAGAGLAVETRFGVGTTFRVFWPLQAKDVGENLEAR
jgi:signal transduction histidine kinase